MDAPAITTRKDRAMIEFENSTNAEIWKAIEIAPDYEVSNHGRVRRAKAGTSPKSRVVVGKILKQKVTGPRRNYLAFSPVIDGVAKSISIHRVVAYAFLPNPSFGQTQVRHIDGNGFNNVAANLAWGSQSENEKDKIAHGTKRRGTEIGNSKLRESDISEIRMAEVAQSKIAKRYNIAQTTVSKIKRRTLWGWVV